LELFPIPQAFSTFDPCGTGRIDVAAFRRVLESVCGAGLSDGQYDHTLGVLGLNREQQQQTVDWKHFLDRLQSPCQRVREARETSQRKETSLLVYHTLQFHVVRD